MTGAILCCGCGLIDMIPVDAADGGRAYRPFGGGSLCNVARALGRLGLPAEFAGGLSSDFFGDELVAGLVASGVGTRFVQRLDAPTTLGFVSLDRDEPSYAFYDIGAADRIWTDPPLPAALDGVGALHFGDIALIREPAAAAFERLFDQEAAGRRVVSLDPNIRPSLVHDEPAYRARLDRMLARADLIKISAADLEWLRPGMSHDDVAAAWRGNGASVVVITRGADGVVGWCGGARVEAPSIPTAIVDTVGAGDSFMAGLLASLHARGALTRDALASLSDATLQAALDLGQRVASMTCARRGADPPWRHELPVSNTFS